MGYLLMLEANAPTDETIDYLRRRTGCPESLFRADRAHATLDPGHQAGMYDLIDRLPLKVSLESLIAECILQAGEHMADCLSAPESWSRTIVDERDVAGRSAALR